MDTYIFRRQIHKLPGKVIHHVPLPEPRVVEGHGARAHVGEICKEKGYKHVLVVTDKTLRDRLSRINLEIVIGRNLRISSFAGPFDRSCPDNTISPYNTAYSGRIPRTPDH